MTFQCFYLSKLRDQIKKTSVIAQHFNILICPLIYIDIKYPINIYQVYNTIDTGATVTVRDFFRFCG